jgi:hypothetical protein
VRRKVLKECASEVSRKILLWWCTMKSKEKFHLSFCNETLLNQQCAYFTSPSKSWSWTHAFTHGSKCPWLFIFLVMDVLLRCKGPPLSQTNLYPSTLVFLVCCIVDKNTFLEHFFMQKKRKRKLLEFLSNSWYQAHIKRDPSNHVLIYPSLDCRHGAQVCDQQTWVYCSHYFFAALALVLISSCLGQVLSTTHFFDCSHTSKTAATLFRIPFKVPN